MSIKREEDEDGSDEDDLIDTNKNNDDDTNGNNESNTFEYVEEEEINMNEEKKIGNEDADIPKCIIMVKFIGSGTKYKNTCIKSLPNSGTTSIIIEERILQKGNEIQKTK